MPNLPISQLPQSSPLQGDELFVDVQDGVTKYTTLNSITYATGNSYGLYTQTGNSTPVQGSSLVVVTSGSLLDGGKGTLTVPANSFQVGDTFHAKLSGKITIANNHDLDIHFKSGNTNLVDAGPITMAGSTDKNWSLDVTFVIRNTGAAGTASILSSGNLMVRTNSAGDVVTEIFSSTNSTTFDTTVDNTLAIEAILDADCGTSEYIYSELFILNKLI